MHAIKAWYDDQEAYLTEARLRWRGSPERFDEAFESFKRALQIVPLDELK